MTTEEQPIGLAAVTDLPISEIIGSADPALAQSLQRILSDIEDSEGVLSAFSSFV